MEDVTLQVLLLALNVFFEAQGEPLQGQLAVAHVLRNRAELCGTSIEHELYRDSQFSWTNQGGKNIPADKGDMETLKIFSKSLKVATLAINTPDVTGGSLFFHRDDITPKWARMKKKTFHVGRHIFYKGGYDCAVDPYADPALKAESKGRKDGIVSKIIKAISSVIDAGSMKIVPVLYTDWFYSIGLPLCLGSVDLINNRTRGCEPEAGADMRLRSPFPGHLGFSGFAWRHRGPPA